MCRKISENLKAIQATPTYQSSLQHLVSEKFWTMMTAPNSGPSFLQYIRDIQIKVQHLSNMNTHVVLDDVKDLTSQMLLHRTPTEKFQNETPNDNDDDNSGNDDNVSKGDDEEQEDDQDEHKNNDEEDKNDKDGNNNDQDNQDENNSGDDQDADGTKN
jgi:Mg-chelatase subunit ChlI